MSNYDDATLVLIPSGYENGVIHCVKPDDSGSEIAFTRGSAAERTNESGEREQVSANTPRIDHDNGCPELLLEIDRENLNPYSHNMSSYGSSSVTITDNTTEVVSMDGGNTAAKVVSTDLSFARLNRTYTLDDNTNYICYAYFQKGSDNTSNVMQFRNKAGTDYEALINLETMAISNRANLTADYFGIERYLDTNWYRAWMRVNSGSGATNPHFRPIFGAGDVSIFTTGEYCYIEGVQVEEGNYPTTIIRTSGTTASRALENGTLTLSDTMDGTWTLFLDIVRITDDSSAEEILQFGSTLNSSEIRIFNRLDGKIRVKATDESAAFDNIYSAVDSWGYRQRMKVALVAVPGRLTLWTNGVAGEVTTSIGTILLDNIALFQSVRVHRMDIYTGTQPDPENLTTL